MESFILKCTLSCLMHFYAQLFPFYHSPHVKEYNTNTGEKEQKVLYIQKIPKCRTNSDSISVRKSNCIVFENTYVFFLIFLLVTNFTKYERKMICIRQGKMNTRCQKKTVEGLLNYVIIRYQKIIINNAFWFLKK